ncbi:hypothetical protein CDIK_2809 [Cucumispora dikerogammari]|nr:hypothetical protein CDIK_2809 [Cucumispora dikerogammari]
MIYVDMWTVFYDLFPTIGLLSFYISLAFIYFWTLNYTSDLNFKKKQDSKASNKDEAILLQTTRDTKQSILSSYVDEFINKYFRDKKNNRESNVNDSTLSLLKSLWCFEKFNDILCLDNNENGDQNDVENNPLTNSSLPLNYGFNFSVSLQNTADPYTESSNESYYDCVSTFQPAATYSKHQYPISPNIDKCSLSGRKPCSKPICTSELNKRLRSVPVADNNPDNNQLPLKKCLADKEQQQKQEHNDNQKIETIQSENECVESSSDTYQENSDTEQSGQSGNETTFKNTEDCPVDTKLSLQNGLSEITTEIQSPSKPCLFSENEGISKFSIKEQQNSEVNVTDKEQPKPFDKHVLLFGQILAFIVLIVWGICIIRALRRSQFS